MSDESKDKNLGDSIKPKPFSGLSLKEKLDLVGIQVLPVTSPGDPPIDPYGITESLDLFILLAIVTNKVVNKDSFLDFDLVKAGFATYAGAKEIPKELRYVTEVELGIIKETIEKTLKFNNPNAVKLEVLVERIAFAGLLVLFSITDYTRKDV